MRPMAIDALLRWAYRDELPKSRRLAGGRIRPAWTAVQRRGELGTLVDEPNVYGVTMIGGIDVVEPHPDAVAVWEAVQALDGVAIDLAPDWAPIEDLGELGEAGAAALRAAVDALTVPVAGRLAMRATPRALVERYAIMGGAPDWEIDPPEVKPVTTRNGMPKWFLREEYRDVYGRLRVVEVDGFDRRARRPKPGAYIKQVLEPDPLLGLVARGEWMVWRAALDVLTNALAGALGAHAARPCAAPLEPWLSNQRAARVLHAIEKA